LLAFLAINVHQEQRNDKALTHFCGNGGRNARLFIFFPDLWQRKHDAELRDRISCAIP